jgi:hypothetical protein
MLGLTFARLFLLTSGIALSAVPAVAADGIQVPEGSSLTLFLLGLAGVIVGRRIARGSITPGDGPTDSSDKS